VQERLGSIEVGKIANLLVMTGDALTDAARLESVFVDGEQYAVVPEPADSTRGSQRGARRPNQENRR
jgi:cytosine/adenosine deaminase-related metal-dependent hydrolase